ncbi:putative metalloprotease [Chitinivorax tropicus]|uniref:Putative metalloprotease n=1 Tax=Chitinivorax tropicus TaxID=714531 RepID=A0A840MCV8_9PROT|nr:M48 family metalloprotease [Chitinivorax tropicus]MBB5017144.1 putative metalloprotease [Chitinivorax tropicus]
MSKSPLLAAMMALALVGCATDGSQGGDVSSVAGALSSVSGAGTGATKGESRISAAGDLLNAATVSDSELKSVSAQQMAYSDKQAQVAPAKNKYAKRLARLTAKHMNEDGMKLNFKVYLTKDVNAFAAPDGSIRVYAGLMDLMNDDELLSVIGHEIGHVKHGHSLNALRTAYVTSAGRKAAAGAGGVVGALADSQLGALTEALVNNQFSQSQETQADDYGFEFMKKYKYKAAAMESAFRKLAQMSGKSSTFDKMMSSHPDAEGRAKRVKEKLSKGG